jgi:hypothetical protein
VTLDLVTSGGAHLTRSVVQADSPGALVELAQRRFALSLSGLERGPMPIVLWVAVLVLARGVIRRRELLAPLDPEVGGRDGMAFRAGIVGALFATVVGAIANDSGPLIALIGTGFLALAVGYARGRPSGAPVPAGRPRGALRRPRSPARPRPAL